MNRKIAIAAIMAAFIGGMFFAGTPVEAKRGGGGDIIDEIWAAITALDARVTSLENKVEPTPLRSVSATSVSFNFSSQFPEIGTLQYLGGLPFDTNAISVENYLFATSRADNIGGTTQNEIKEKWTLHEDAILEIYVGERDGSNNILSTTLVCTLTDTTSPSDCGVITHERTDNSMFIKVIDNGIFNPPNALQEKYTMKMYSVLEFGDVPP